MQAVREAEKQAAHDAAIFGLPVDRSGDSAPGTKMPEKAPVFVPGDSEEDEEDRPVIVEEEPQARAQQPETEAEVKAVCPATSFFLVICSPLSLMMGLSSRHVTS